jgi:hypothetical protein
MNPYVFGTDNKSPSAPISYNESVLKFKLKCGVWLQLAMRDDTTMNVSCTW